MAGFGPLPTTVSLAGSNGGRRSRCRFSKGGRHLSGTGFLPNRGIALWRPAGVDSSPGATGLLASNSAIPQFDLGDEHGRRYRRSFPMIDAFWDWLLGFWNEQAVQRLLIFGFCLLLWIVA